MRESIIPGPAIRWALAVIVLCILTVKATAQQKIPVTVRVSINRDNISLKEILKQVEQQTGTRFFYADRILSGIDKMSVHVSNEPLQQLLDKLLTENKLNWNYNAQQKTIEVTPTQSRRELESGNVTPSSATGTIVSGRVTSATGEALPGAYVLVKGTNKKVTTDERGAFTITDAPSAAVLIFSTVGYRFKEIEIGQQLVINVSLEVEENVLDEMVIQAYGTTTRRINTGNIAKVSGDDIRKQPVSNPLAALQGRVAGLLITQVNGIPGSGFKVQLRGQSSIGVLPGIRPATDPLFIIDGVPFAANNNPLDRVGSAIGAAGLSPLNSINPSDIESIEVLKDADATAIYGSRGANGVVLITTRKGEAGKVKVDLNVYTGISQVAKAVELLNTEQYRAVRKEALANDGLTPSVTNASDLLLWDSTKYTDWKKVFIGNNAHMYDAQLSVSGGTANTRFLLGGGMHRETTVFPGSFPNLRSSVNLNLNHTSTNKKFNANFSAIYSNSNNKLPLRDLTGMIRLLPNAPDLYDPSGNLTWEYKGVAFTNPLSYLYKKYNGIIDNLISNLQISQEIFSDLTIKASLGYNTIRTQETLIDPIASRSPAIGTGQSFFGFGDTRSWIIEPQVEYKKAIASGKLTVMIGGTWQQNNATGTAITGSGYTSDVLISSLAAAPGLSATNTDTRYSYQAFFGRINYNWKSRYIVNLTGRRDGSSRFGPGRKFGNFGAVGANWIFSGEEWMKTVNWLSFGKLRASYGTVGNDQIGDYAYLNLWNTTAVSTAYQGISGLVPSALFNPDFSWESGKKLEIAAEAGFFKDAILLSVTYYRNRSSNQLISYPLPSQVGFPTIGNKNFPATIENKGVEIELNTKNIRTSNWNWSTAFNITIPTNKLIAFPGIETSNYAATLEVGRSMTNARAFRFTGVNPTTGLFEVEDAIKDAVINDKDKVVFLNTDAKWFAGLTNTITFKGWQLTWFFEGRAQKALNYLSTIYSTVPPGTLGSDRWNNQPVAILDRWQKAGDQAAFQRYTTSGSLGTPTASTALFLQSDQNYVDGTFVKLRTVAFSYTLPQALLRKLKLNSCRVYVQGQNLLTITGYKGTDPETQNVFGLPPLRTITAGIQLNF